MKVALLHYHLRRGGVSSVILRQVASLGASGAGVETAIVVGTPPEVVPSVPCVVAPGLDYDAFDTRSDRKADGVRLADSVERALAEAFPGGCDLIHVHNPLIKKNSRILDALEILRGRGHALLVQIHDLAEDFRPEVYDGKSPYPESCDYAAINERDRDRLVASGLEAEHVHFLPNPVAFLDGFDPRKGYALESKRGRRTLLYPVRAIGRKNIGEALLLSRFLPEGAELAITLPPTSPGDERAYRAWKDLAAARRLPIRFEAGLGSGLQELYDSAFGVVTTSVKEGFGYSYLDPLVRGLPVTGREIPHIVGDFSKKGVRFSGLYRGISVPRSSIPEGLLREAVMSRIASFRKAYAPAFDGDRARLDEALARLLGRFEGEILDFGALDRGLQASLLSRICSDSGFSAEIEGLNPFLGSMFLGAEEEAEAARLRESVLSGYSERDYATLLRRAYESAAGKRARGRIDRARFIESYLEPASLFLCAS